jgi:hypothetical protein
MLSGRSVELVDRPSGRARYWAVSNCTVHTHCQETHCTLLLTSVLSISTDVDIMTFIIVLFFIFTETVSWKAITPTVDQVSLLYRSHSTSIFFSLTSEPSAGAAPPCFTATPLTTAKIHLVYHTQWRFLRLAASSRHRIVRKLLYTAYFYPSLISTSTLPLNSSLKCKNVCQQRVMHSKRYFQHYC